MERVRDVPAGRRLETPEAASGSQPGVEPIPGWLVVRLIHTVGLSEEEVRRMSDAEARAAWERYRSDA